jgi:hypothetical protein
LNQLGFTGNADDLEAVLDFLEEKHIRIETKSHSTKTPLGILYEYSAEVFYEHYPFNVQYITTTPNCVSLTGVLRLSCLYGARYLYKNNTN